MSNKPYKGFEPNWLLTPAPENSYRSIFRWGDPNFFKYPKESLYTLMKEKFQMTDDDFKAYSDDTGFDPVELPDHPVQLAPEHIDARKASECDEIQLLIFGALSPIMLVPLEGDSFTFLVLPERLKSE